MTQPVTSRAVPIIKGFFQLSYGLAWGILGLWMIGGIAIPFSMTIRKAFSFFPFPFRAAESVGSVAIGGREFAAGVTRASGRLTVEGGPPGLSVLVWLFLGFLVVVALIVMKQILKLIGRVEDGKFFLPENARIIRTIGFVFIAYWFLEWLGNAVVIIFLSGNLKSSAVVLDKSGIFPDFGGLVVPLLFFVIAEIFKFGTALKEDQDLTI
jgi:hypothetical protein